MRSPGTIRLAGLLLAGPCLAFSPPAPADKVVLLNGDRLTGNLVRQEGATLQLKTGYAGTVEIAWEQVASVSVDEPTPILLEDDTVIRAVAITLEGDTAVVQQANGDSPLRLTRDQVSTVNPRPWELGERGNFSGRVNFSGESERGNNDSDEFDLDFNLTYRRKQDRTRAFGDIERDRTSGQLTKSKWLVTGRHDRFLDERQYISGRLSLEHDKFANLTLRTVAGPSLGYQFYEGKERNLLAEGGILLTYEDFSNQADNTYWGPGWQIDYDEFIWYDVVQAYHEQTGVVGLAESGKIVWKSWTGLRVPLMHGIVGSAELKVEYDSEPANEADSTDTTYRLKLGYQW